MSTLYGSIEYFEKQIENYLTMHKYKDFRIIWSGLEKEILHDSFVEDEEVRQKFLQNLRIAAEHYKVKHQEIIK
ncbi:hypothetical protein ACWM35_17690 [Neobacillus sp. K501]